MSDGGPAGGALDAAADGTGSAASTGPRLGVLVPCRNEALVIARRIANLALCEWPAAGAPHRIVIIDDGCDDDTAAVAREAIAASLGERDDLRAEVVANTGRPGKAGAIAYGLAALCERQALASGEDRDVDVVVLTDADVVLREDALLRLAAAFAPTDGALMACGSQEFVDALGDDGRPLDAQARAPRPAGGLYDRITAWVRALESRAGLLFSVHGQLLAWHASLGLTPTPGLAADDLDLMLAARARGARTRKLDDARFLEVKTPPDARGREQALRRARAYVQIVRKADWPRPRGALEALQLAFYRRVPLAAPWLALGAALLGLVLVALLVSPTFTLLLTFVGVLVAGFGPGARLVRLLVVIARATREESREDLGDRWEMPRA